MVTTGFADVIAERMAAEHALLAARWFARLNDLLPVGANEVFPSNSLLDHIPSLIVDISGYIKSPEIDPIAANSQVVNKARELGTLRHQQRASLHQVLREYQLLGSILLRFVEDESIRLMLTPPPSECIAVVCRIHGAVSVLLQETVETFVALYTATITEQSERLRQFTRMATHEWRQPLAPVATAVSLLRMPNVTPAIREQAVALIGRNVTNLVEMTYKLERVARLDGNTDSPSLQSVSVTVIAGEAARQLREMADARDVQLRVAEDMPRVVVDVGRLELALVNLISNAVKYSDPGKPERYVEITALTAGDGSCVLSVRDNGIGIPSHRITQIFRRFTRAHSDQPEFESLAGVGLGLAIVDDCVNAMGGTITVESVEGTGTEFKITLPCPDSPEESRHPGRDVSNTAQH